MAAVCDAAVHWSHQRHFLEGVLEEHSKGERCSLCYVKMTLQSLCIACKSGDGTESLINTALFALYTLISW